MNNLMKIAMVLTVAVQASAQSEMKVTKITSNPVSQLKDKDFLGNNSTKNIELSMPKIFEENGGGLLKPSNFDIKKVGEKSKASVGGHDGNGGDTALDPETQKRTLLDLIEKDDMVPVLLDAGKYDEKLNSNLYYYYFTSAEVNGTKFYRTAFGSPAFTYLFFSAAGKFDLEPCKTVELKKDSFLDIHYVPAVWNGCSLYATKDFFNFVRSTSLKAKALKWYFTTENLEDIRDEGLIRLVDASTKKQVAIQKDGIVVINEAEFRKMDDRSKSALLYHEMVIYAVVNLNPKLIEEKGTEPIRTFVRRIIRQIDGITGQKERVADEWVMESFSALGLP